MTWRIAVACVVIVLSSLSEGFAQPREAPAKQPFRALDAALGRVAMELQQGAAPRMVISELGNALAVADRIPVSIYTHSEPETLSWLQERSVEIANRHSGVIECYLPAGLLGELDGLTHVLRVREITPDRPRVTSQGVASHNALNWHSYGYFGTGVKVGVIDTFQGISMLLGSEIPSLAAARCYSAVGVYSASVATCDAGASGHGTAVTESLVDVSPGVQLYIANPISFLDFRNTIDWMVSQGVRVINYSAARPWDGPGNGTSPYPDSPLRSVDAAVAGGALFVTAAGNEGESTWYGSFIDTNFNGWAEFGGLDDNLVDLAAGQTVIIQLRWDDVWGGATRDLDLSLYNSFYTQVAVSTTTQSGGVGHTPFEILSYTAPAAGRYYIGVNRYSGAVPGWIQLQNFTSTGLGVYTASHSIGNPAESANPGVLAVGAAAWSTSSVIEIFSSRGPTPDGRTKPDLTGVDRADTVTMGPSGFAGTSQASPHVAGLAALVFQAFPSYTPTQTAAYLKSFAASRGTGRPNNTWGYGFAMLPSICVVSASPTSLTFGSASSAQPITVTASNPDCSWTASAGAAWLTLSASNGVGGGIVTLTASANTSIATRTATATIAGTSVSVTQAAGTASFTVTPTSWSAPAAGGLQSVTVTVSLTDAPWTAASNAAWLTVSTAGGTGSGSVTLTAALNASGSARSATATIAGTAVSVTQAGATATVATSRTSLQFGASHTGSGFAAKTGAQVVRLTQSGPGTVSWTASSSQPWLQVSPASGTSLPATLSVSVVHHASVPMSGTSTGSIAFTFTGASNSAGPVAVTLTTTPAGTSTPPFGTMDTPAHNLSGVTGSIAVTGWALDDLDVVRVRILRSAHQGSCNIHDPNSLVFIGNATSVEGARPDVAVAYPAAPRNTRAGWGYMLLTNFLPNLGNGTFTLCAVADDVEGRSALLGWRTITVDNANAVKPFGAIDTPDQGATIGGTSYHNFGWVLSRTPARADPPGGGSVTVFINSRPVGTPSGWTSRSDLTALFPAATYPGVVNAAGVFTFNPASIGDGVHTIAWSVTNNQGFADGVGSRFFTISGTGAGSTATAGAVRSGLRAAGPAEVPAPALLLPARLSLGQSLAAAVAGAPLELSALQARRGFNLLTPFTPVPVEGGRASVQGEELDRFEVQLGAGGLLTGYMRVGDELGPLPIGSHLDQATGTFGWMPGVGFVGRYDLVFVRWDGHRAVSRQEVRFVMHAQGSGRIGPQVMLDTPTADLWLPTIGESGVSGKILIAGWALDVDDPVDTGVSTLHVWAYAVDETGQRQEPRFLGITSYGGARPDVAAVFGERYLRTGYGLLAEGLEPGTYDLAVFAWSTVRNAFVPARVVRVHVR